VKSDDLDSVEAHLDYLAAGPESVQHAESACAKVAQILFEANGYVVTRQAHDFGVDLIAQGATSDSVAVAIKCPVHSLTAPQIQQLIAMAEGRTHSQYLLMTNGRLRPEAATLARQAAALSVGVLTLDGLRGWVRGIRHRTVRPGGAAVELITQLSRELIRLIAREPTELYKIEWRDLERTLAQAFEGLGFKVTLTPSAKDGGKDIILECTELGTRRSYIVEIKHWVCGKSVGNRHVRKFVNVVLNEQHESGLFLSTSGFAGTAFESVSEVEFHKLRVGSHEKMVSICKTYVKAETGLWAPEKEFGELLYEGTELPSP
jgi:restriction system protein